MLSLPPVLLALASSAYAQSYSATYLPGNAPKTTENGQTGTNQCGGGHDQNSMCQNAYLNAVDDFCLFAPPQPGPGSTIGNTERIEVSWCIRDGYGTRLIPEGSIQGAHFIQTPDFVQITGHGDLTKLNIPAGDAGGELDPHGADGNGNPIGGLVFSSAFGALRQTHEWTNFMSSTEFCFRACKDGPKAPALCQHIYDVMGCMWNMPGKYGDGFDRCAADSGEPMGVYGGSTFHQGQPVTPPAHPAPQSSNCATFQSIAYGASVSPGDTTTTTTSGNSTTTTTSSNSVSNSSSSTSTTGNRTSTGTSQTSTPPPGSTTTTTTGDNGAPTDPADNGASSYSRDIAVVALAGAAVLLRLVS